MRLLQILFIFTMVHSLYAQEQNTTKDKNATFINVVSNIPNTTIILDGKEIGQTPIKHFRLKPYMEHNITALNNDSYHEKNITRTIALQLNELRTEEFTFEPLQAEVFLVGEEGELYINGEFQKKLLPNNRVMKIKADSNISFGIYKKEKQVEFKRDLQGGEFEQIKYELKDVPEEIALYTTRAGMLIWEDKQESVTQNINFEAAQRYCKNLSIAFLQDWRLPSIEELNTLYEKHKDDIYHGYGEPFYWSMETFDGDSGIWQYAKVKNFTVDGQVKDSIQEFENGKVRCVHHIGFDDDIKVQPADNMEIPEQIMLDEQQEAGDYDPSLTKDLQQYLLK